MALTPGVIDAQSSPAGTVMQAQTETNLSMPANARWVDFDRVSTMMPSDSTRTFTFDVRAMAYVTAGAIATTCRIGLTNETSNPNYIPMMLSPPVDVPPATTVAIPLEATGTAFAGQLLRLAMELRSGAAPLTIQQWTSVTAEVIPSE
ncbi:MAG: hypothetical protein JO071_04375 [Deltaproteobacteria bacterium]|nr:hypothetical protein [Deltaproteobacteria bacterium]